MKNLIMLVQAISFIFILLFICGCSNKSNVEKSIIKVHADCPHYDTLSDLYEKAELVIEGKVLESRVELMCLQSELTEEEKIDPKLNPRLGTDTPDIRSEQPVTVYTIEVISVYKGEAVEKDIIEIKTMGGETDTEIYIVEETPEIDIDAEYIMFISTYDNVPGSLLNPTQAYYKAEDNKLIGSSRFSFELSYEDLENLKANEMK